MSLKRALVLLCAMFAVTGVSLVAAGAQTTGGGEEPPTTLVVSGYDNIRTDPSWGLFNTYFDSTRGYLADPGSFGPTGTVPVSFELGTPVSVANATTLAGTDVFITGWVPTGSYDTNNDKQALYDFVLGGGTLIATTDDAGHSMVDAFGLEQSSSSSSANSFDSASHPIAEGPFGTQPTFLQYGTIGSYSKLGSFAQPVARNTLGQVTIAEIPPGTLGPDSGLVLFVADVDFFTDYQPGASFGAADNEVAIKNLFAYVAESAGVSPGEAQLLQVVPSTTGTQTAVAGRASGPAGVTRTVEILTSGSCLDGELAAPSLLAEVEVTFDAKGEAFFAETVTNIDGQTAGPYAAARVRNGGVIGAESSCVVAQADNDAWTRASPVSGSATGVLDSSGNSRWYRFPIQPGARVTVELTELSKNYDLALYTDISQAFEELVGDDDVDGLNQLSAEFAPAVFSPAVFSPAVFSPAVFSPDAYSPAVFSPAVFSPAVFSPAVFSPAVFSPAVFSPAVFSPAVFSPAVFSADAFSPAVFSPAVFSPAVFSEANYASAQVRSLTAVAAANGTADEVVVADTWGNTGEFYVRVTGRNGAFDVNNPFQLSVSVDGQLCNGVGPIGPAAVSPVSGNPASIILWDSARMGAAYSAAEAAAIETKLTTLALRSDVGGVVVDLADYSHIAALHAQADTKSSCPYAENLTAQATKAIIDAHRGPATRYVVLVGDDDQIPFYRYPDQALLGPEENYDPPVRNDTQSQASLRLNYILGQDQYGAVKKLNLRDGPLPIPNLAVGRLVESPTEIATVIDAYLFGTAGGVVPEPTSTLSTGYDFLADAADGVQEEFVLGTTGATNDTLIDAATVSPVDGWTADDLRTEFLEKDHDLVFLAGHFSANSALAADYQTQLIVTELAESDVDLENAIVFSSGCHSAYNIVDGDAVPGVTLPLDWTQAFAQKGATLIGGTGYQYGDTDFLEYSERLYVLFARELRRGTGPVSVGEAMVRAKQEFLATTPEIRPLHYKSVLISTVFGLPMLSIDMPGERFDEPNGGSSVTPTPAVSAPGSVLGLKTAELTVTPTLTEEEVPLTNLDGPDLVARYLAGPNGVVTNVAEPAIPLVRQDVSVLGTSLRGVGFRGGSWSEADVVPLTGAPATELRGVHTPFVSTVNFPMRLAKPNYYGALSGTGGTVLNITPAQHRVDTVGNQVATRRSFSELDFRLFYSNNTQTYVDPATNAPGNTPALSAPPTFTNVRAVTEGSDIVFFARVVGDPAAGIQEVWVTHTDGSQTSGTWASLDLTQDPTDSTLWTGRLDGAVGSFGRLDYVLQAANGVGLVTLDDNFGSYYQILGSIDEVEPDGTPTVEPAPTALSLSAAGTATYGQDLQVSATLSPALSGQTVVFSIGGSGRAATTDESGVASVSVPVTASAGSYNVTASYAGDVVNGPSSAAKALTVTKAPTVLVLEQGESSLTPLGVSTGISARLTDATDAPLLERTVFFSLSSPSGELVVVPRITDNLGRATLGTLPLAGGSYTVKAQFLGTIETPTQTLDLESPTYLAAAPVSGTLVVNTPPAVTVEDLVINEGDTASIVATATDADVDDLTYLWTGVDPAVATLDPTDVLSPTVTGIDDGTVTSTLAVNDGVQLEPTTAQATVTVLNVAPTVDSVTVPLDPVGINTPVTLDVAVSDPGTNDELTVTIDWGDGTSETLTPTEGQITANHDYAAAGVYAITVNVCDDDGGCSDDVISDFVVVYDPSAGFVTGGGWIYSGAGAYLDDVSAEGRANFGFVAKYKKGATVPDGNTIFKFKAADLNFESTSYDWLVVAGSRAQFRGQGTINGEGSYDFTLTGIDGDPDQFRIQIWDRETDSLVYDNKRGEGEDPDVEGTALGGGSIQVHTPKGKN